MGEKGMTENFNVAVPKYYPLTGCFTIYLKTTKLETLDRGSLSEYKNIFTHLLYPEI